MNMQDHILRKNTIEYLDKTSGLMFDSIGQIRSLCHVLLSLAEDVDLLSDDHFCSVNDSGLLRTKVHQYITKVQENFKRIDHELDNMTTAQSYYDVIIQSFSKDAFQLSNSLEDDRLSQEQIDHLFKYL
jgi:hypothetical protein